MTYRLETLSNTGWDPLTGDMKTIADWLERKDSISRIWKEYIGEMPERAEVNYTVLSETKEEDHVRLHLRYVTGFGDWVTAYLLVPGHSANPDGKYAAVLAMHPTNASGKGDIASPEGRPDRLYGMELVSRGYVVLAPDLISAGERIYDGCDAFQTAPFYEQFPRSTAVGKMIHDHQQGLDLLSTLPFVDANRYGAIGHSIGGYNAFMLASMDDRIQAIVCSCGLSSFAGDANPERWGERDWFSHIPRLSEDLAHGEVPFEWHEIAALCAPTPFFNWMGQQDAIFPHWISIAKASLEISRLYSLLGAEDQYVAWMGNDGHSFPENVREASYQFMNKWLRE